MGHERSVITAAASTAVLLAAVGCGGNDSGSRGAQTTAPPGHLEVTYRCPELPDRPELAGPVQVVDAGVCAYEDGLSHVTYGMVLENTSDETLRNVIVDVKIRDSQGLVHGREIPHQIFALGPGQRTGSAYFSVVQGGADAASLEVDVDIPEPIEGADELPSGEIRVSDVSTTVEEGERATTFTLTSTYSRGFETGLSLFVVYRDAEGRIVGGDDDFLTGLGPRGTVTHTVTSSNTDPDITEAEIYPNPDPAAPH
jgi:hypothetical protein